jgi:hypothetical protein
VSLLCFCRGCSDTERQQLPLLGREEENADGQGSAQATATQEHQSIDLSSPALLGSSLIRSGSSPGVVGVAGSNMSPHRLVLGVNSHVEIKLACDGWGCP